MTDEFLVVFKLLGVREVDESGRRVPSDEVIRQLRADPEELEEVRGLWEQILKSHARSAAEKLLRLLLSTSSYLSNLIDGPVPVLLPRKDVDLLGSVNGDGDGSALVFAKSLQRLVRTQTTELQRPHDEQLLAKIEDMIARVGAGAVPADKRHLTSEQVAARLGLAPKTVRKLFNQGKLIGRKLAGGEWRTTQDDLDNSPYLRERNGRGRAKME